ncbi:MAG: phosphotransferase [Chloroflexi bacterium]|nr:phosphotransferase [Chloroflexota bacterium]
MTSTLRDVYLVTCSQGKYVLYIYRHGQRTADEISAEWQFVDYLYASGVTVAPAVPRNSGEYQLSFFAPEGIRFGVLPQFVEGVILRNRPSINAVRAFGQILARIHELSDLMPFTLNRPRLDFEKMIQDAVTIFEEEAFDRMNDWAYLRESAQILQLGLGELRGLSYGIIHGDVIRANALVADNGAITVIDFDFCGLSWRAYDIVSLLLTIRNTPQEQEFEKAFLEGYADVRPLASEEKDAFPLLEAIRAIVSIGIPAMNIEHWGSQYFYAFVDNNLAALRRSMSQIGKNSASRTR